MTPDRQTARQWLDQELSRPEYTERLSWWHRVQRWLEEQFSGNGINSITPSGAALWITIALLLLTVAVLALSVGRWRSGATSRTTPKQAVFTDQVHSAAHHRELAENALAHGDHRTAIQEAFRAVTRDLQERTVVPERVGLTASEVAAIASPAFPALAAQIDEAARLFNDVTYGHLPPSAQQAHHLVHLSHETACTRPAALEQVS